MLHHFQHEFTSFPPYSSIILGVRLQVLYSHMEECTKIPWESLTSMVISFTLVNSLHKWLVIKWFIPCSTSRNYNHMVRFVSSRVWLKEPRLYDILPRLRWSLFWFILHRSTFYWSWLCYHLIIDLRLCLVAMIMFSQSLLSWICIVLVGSHVMIHLRFESIVLQ